MKQQQFSVHTSALLSFLILQPRCDLELLRFKANICASLPWGRRKLCHLTATDWENFGKEEKEKKKQDVSPPPQERSPPTRDSQLETLIDLRGGCTLTLTLIQHRHLKQITAALRSLTAFHHVWDAQTPPSPGHIFLPLMALPPPGTSESSRWALRPFLWSLHIPKKNDINKNFVRLQTRHFPALLWNFSELSLSLSLSVPER